MIKWTIYFAEGNVQHEFPNETEEDYAFTYLDYDRDKMLKLWDSKTENALFVNLHLVKCIHRQVIALQAPALPTQDSTNEVPHSSNLSGTDTPT